MLPELFNSWESTWVSRREVLIKSDQLCWSGWLYSITFTIEKAAFCSYLNTSPAMDLPSLHHVHNACESIASDQRTNFIANKGWLYTHA